MSPSERAEEMAASLLAAQLADLARFRHVVEAQRAVLRMGDAGLLDAFSREADGLVNDLSMREVRLLAIRAAAQGSEQLEAPASLRLAELDVQIERARAGALSEVASLARDMSVEASGIARSIREGNDELNRLMNGYRRAPSVERASLLDRTG